MVIRAGDDADTDVGAGNDAAQHMELVETVSREMLRTMHPMLRVLKHRWRSAEVADALRELGESQMWVLQALIRGKQLTSELARHHNVTDPTMTRIIDGLVDRGYVERQHDREDRRRIYLRLTPAGREIAEQARRQFCAVLAEFLSPLSDDQLADIMRAFQHIRSLLPEEHSREDGC
jgi:DNA-binding MarR family transcriptional regulator